MAPANHSGIRNTRTAKKLLNGMLAVVLAASMTLGAALAQEAENQATTSLKIGSASEKVPAGTMMTIAFNSAMDSRISQPGEPFTALIQHDFKSGRRVILPEGSVVRGRILDVKRPGLFSKGGAITLDFDHVLVPNGELLPLELNLSTANTIVNQAGALYTDPGIGKKVSKGAQEGGEMFRHIRDAGVESGKDIAGGLGMIVTVPAAVAGGAVAGAGLTAGKAVKAVVGRGESVVIKPGDTVTIDFGGSFNLPAE